METKKNKFGIRIRMPEWFEAPSYVASYKRFRPINQLRRKSATKVADLLKFALKSNKVGRVILDHPSELFEFIFQDSSERLRYAAAYYGLLKHLFPQAWGLYTDFSKRFDIGRGSPIIGIGDLIKIPEGSGSIFKLSPMPEGSDIDIIGWYGAVRVLDPAPIIWLLKHCPRFALWAEKNYIQFTQRIIDIGFSRTDAVLMLDGLFKPDYEFSVVVENIMANFRFTSPRDFVAVAREPFILKRVGLKYAEQVGDKMGLPGLMFTYGTLRNFRY